MILTGNEDLRIIKTIESIKKTFEALIFEKNYEKITVKELCDRARINKKTFYHYYDSLDALLAEIQTELSMGFIERIKDYELPEDLDQVNREFFLYSVEQGVAYEKITCSGSYHSIRDDMILNVNNKGWERSKKYQKLSNYEKKVLMSFINNIVLDAYKEWIKDGKKIPLDDVIDITNRIVLGGVNGFFK